MVHVQIHHPNLNQCNSMPLGLSRRIAITLVCAYSKEVNANIVPDIGMGVGRVMSYVLPNHIVQPECDMTQQPR